MPYQQPIFSTLVQDAVIRLAENRFLTLDGAYQYLVHKYDSSLQDTQLNLCSVFRHRRHPVYVIHYQTKHKDGGLHSWISHYVRASFSDLKPFTQRA